MTTAKRTLPTAPTDATAVVAPTLVEQLRADSSRGCSGYLIANRADVGSTVHSFCGTDWHALNNNVARGVAIVVASAGARGPMLDVVRLGRRTAMRYPRTNVGPTLEGTNARRWLQEEIDAITALPDLRGLPMLVLIEENVAGESHDWRQWADRLASENSCVLAVTSWTEDREPRWQVGLFDVDKAVA